jgi:hypothetical protein
MPVAPTHRFRRRPEPFGCSNCCQTTGFSGHLNGPDDNFSSRGNCHASGYGGRNGKRVQEVRASPVPLHGAGRREVLQPVLQGSRWSGNRDRVRLRASGMLEVKSQSEVNTTEVRPGAKDFLAGYTTSTRDVPKLNSHTLTHTTALLKPQGGCSCQRFCSCS